MSISRPNPTLTFESPVSSLLNMEEAAAFLRIKMSTLYAWVHQRIVPYRKHGGRTVFSGAELTAWSEARRVSERRGIDFIPVTKNDKKRATPRSRSRSLTIEFDEEAIRTTAPKRS